MPIIFTKAVAMQIEILLYRATFYNRTINVTLIWQQEKKITMCEYLFKQHLAAKFKSYCTIQRDTRNITDIEKMMCMQKSYLF